eukprot:CAMPEP_0197455896 /NCGR_PEP_ID=MMETSP1175-20131217/41963_1 /TAXON_ID=1003142 /ORGANISM="Triceratium dubium, Strain CCMP147" /LENGTH=105 /DNA_ID=CAMNT_0042989871 /DNA_START=73 /DNA_END=386 /DNA_ORIENTATION=+
MADHARYISLGDDSGGIADDDDGSGGGGGIVLPVGSFQDSVGTAGAGGRGDDVVEVHHDLTGQLSRDAADDDKDGDDDDDGGGGSSGSLHEGTLRTSSGQRGEQG